MLVYADKEDYKSYAGLEDGTELPYNLDALLSAGSLAVRRYTSVCVYHVDDEDKPADPLTLQAFKDATCAHALAMNKLGIDPDKGGVVDAGTYAAKSISGASFSYATAEQQATARLRQSIAIGVLSPTGQSILDMAGLTTTGPWRVG